MSTPIRLGTVVLDCPDPSSLAQFYAELLGGRSEMVDPDWWEVHVEGTAIKLAFQLVESYIAPAWPNGSPQQLHLDFEVSNLDQACERAAALGAVALSGRVEEASGYFVVHADPAGHPFCLCVER